MMTHSQNAAVPSQCSLSSIPVIGRGGKGKRERDGSRAIPLRLYVLYVNILECVRLCAFVCVWWRKERDREKKNKKEILF
mmetsp:Transcript_31090/g.33399  ORF Transcript_31090/g.33399 Transcript_31090/m.33399 type:complete len:80 (-) Transcript_31090:711-950(-)